MSTAKRVRACGTGHGYEGRRGGEGRVETANRTVTGKGKVKGRVWEGSRALEEVLWGVRILFTFPARRAWTVARRLGAKACMIDGGVAVEKVGRRSALAQFGWTRASVLCERTSIVRNAAFGQLT